MVKRSLRSCNVTGSSIMLNIIALSRCLVYSFNSCFIYEKSCAPCFISSSTFSTALFHATYALKTLPICFEFNGGSMSSERRIATMRSTESSSDSVLITFLTFSGASENFFSFSHSTSSSILLMRESMDFWKLLIPSLRVKAKIRCIKDLAPKG